MENSKIIANVGIGLAVMLLLCLLPMPYGYYVLVRFIAMVVFIAFAYNFYKQKLHVLCGIASSLALLFQPFAKIALGRTLWNIVDVVVAIALVVYWLVLNYDNNK